MICLYCGRRSCMHKRGFAVENDLLVQCASVRPDPDAIRSLISQRLDWEYILERAAWHGVGPLASVCLKQYAVPREFAVRLDQQSREATGRNLSGSAELGVLLSAFERNNLVTVPLKGPVLGLHLYGNIGLREFGDLDLL